MSLLIIMSNWKTGQGVPFDGLLCGSSQEAEVPAHSSNILLVNPDGPLVEQPCFDAALYEGNPIFEQFRTNRLHPQGSAQR